MTTKLNHVKRRASLYIISAIFLLISQFLFCQEKVENLALNKKVVVSSVREGYAGRFAVDGVINDQSRWLSDKFSSDDPWLEIYLDKVYHLGGVHIYSGFENENAITDFHIQFKQNENWIDIPSAHILGNDLTELEVVFHEEVPVKTDALRFVFTKTPNYIARIREIMIWPYSPTGIPKLKTSLK